MEKFHDRTAAAAAMTAAMAFSSLAAVAKVDDDLPENRHIVSVASGGYETGFQIKAAHGADIYETTSYPIDKKADGEDEIGTVSQGKKIEFYTELQSSKAACTLCCNGIQRLTGKLRKGDSQSPRT